MGLQRKKNSTREPSAYQRLEDVIGCKWSVSVLTAVAEGISRPGALERHIEGISTKVLSERLRKLTLFGLLEKQSFAELPPRTEYHLTDAGAELVSILNQVRKLDVAIRKRASKKSVVLPGDGHER